MTITHLDTSVAMKLVGLESVQAVLDSVALIGLTRGDLLVVSRPEPGRDGHTRIGG